MAPVEELECSSLIMCLIMLFLLDWTGKRGHTETGGNETLFFLPEKTTLNLMAL